jgi:hypothetical protein
MHDPMVVAHEIWRPWPKISRPTHRGDGRRIAVRYQWAKWYKPWSGWMKFWRFGAVELYWPGLITIWHVEPGGHDSGEVCKHHRRWQDDDGNWHSKATRRWKWHVHHWKIQIRPLGTFRRWLLTRCEWCGGKSRKGDYVNCSHQWDGERGPWWRGERGLFHMDCSSIETAHRTCICPDPLLDSRGYGKCAVCGGFRAWSSAREDHPMYPKEQSALLLQSIPKGQRDPAKTAQVSQWWSEWRAIEREQETDA